MKYFNLITDKTQSFITDDIVDDVAAHNVRVKDGNNFVAILSYLRTESYDLHVQGFLKTLHFYDFANAEK